MSPTLQEISFTHEVIRLMNQIRSGQTTVNGAMKLVVQGYLALEKPKGAVCGK